MPAPSRLAIATSAVSRLVKEEASYHEELKAQEKRVANLIATENRARDDENDNFAYELKQEVSFFSRNNFHFNTSSYGAVNIIFCYNHASCNEYRAGIY